MATIVSWNATSFTVPAVGEQNWGGATKVDGLLVSLANNGFQKTGGLFTLSADVDFGASAGVIALYHKSRSANVALTGSFRMATADIVAWRNNANSADLPLTTDASDNLLYNGHIISTSAGVLPVASGGTGLSSYAIGDMIYATGVTTLSKLTIGSVNKAMVSTGTAPSWALLVNANIDPAAAIAYSKLALTGAILNADLAGSIAASKLVGSDIATVGTITSGTWSATTIAINKGGTGQTTQTAAFNALSPMTTKGDTVVHTGANAVRQAIGTDGQVLVADSSQTNGLKWTTLSQGAKNYITYNNFENNATTGWSLATTALTSLLPTTVLTAGVAYASAYYVFTVTSANATVGATFTNNAQTFTVVATIAAQTLLVCTGTGAPLASGTLTKATGSGDATITFSAFKLTNANGNLSIAIVSSSQLAGTYSLSYTSSSATTAGDMLVSQAYTIDAEDQAKMMTGKFYYKAQTNPTNGNWSGTSSNSFGIYIYDVTNGAWIQPAGVYNITQSSGIGYCTFTWQTPSNMTQFQVALLNVNASAGAITVYLDDFTVGPQTAPQGPAASDWQSYSVTIGATTTPPTKGTVVRDLAYWRRVGDSMEIRYDYQQSAAGASGTGVYLIPLPSGYTIDSSKCYAASTAGTGVVGTFAISANGAAFNGVVLTFNSTNFSVKYSDTTGASGSMNDWGSTAAPLSTAGTTNFTMTILVPITGWSSNVSMSNDTDTRVVAFRGTNTAGTSFNADTQIPFTSDYDTHGGWSTNQYTVPVSGFYRVTASLFTQSVSMTTSQVVRLNFKQNSQEDIVCNTVGSGTSNAWWMGGTKTWKCVAGDVLSVWALSSVTPSLDTTSGRCYLTIERVSGPATIAANETVAARGTNIAGTSISSATDTLVAMVVDFDTHGALATGGLFTAPVSGKYAIKGCVTFVDTIGVGNLMALKFKKNTSTQLNEVRLAAFSASSNYYACSASDTVRLLAGDTVGMYAWQNSGSGKVLSTLAGQNYFVVERIGNY